MFMPMWKIEKFYAHVGVYFSGFLVPLDVRRRTQCAGPGARGALRGPPADAHPPAHQLPADSPAQPAGQWPRGVTTVVPRT